jgi:hypothetical protein
VYRGATARLFPLPFTLCARWSLIEERAHGKGSQAVILWSSDGDALADESNAEERRLRGEVYFPTRLLRQPLMFRDFDLIAIADRKGQTLAHSPLTAKYATEPLQDIEQIAPQYRVIHLIRL